MKTVKVIFFLIFCLCIAGCLKKTPEKKAGGAKKTKVVKAPVSKVAVEKPNQAITILPEAQTQEPRANPFLTAEEERIFKEGKERLPASYLVLSAVLYAPPLSKAVINGRILKLGDVIDNKEVVQIQREAVVLREENTEYIVKLKKVTDK